VKKTPEQAVAGDVRETARHAGVPSLGPAPLGPSHAERGTRNRVARLILEHGPISASALGQRLGLTPAAVRRHLDTLIADEMIETRRDRPQARRGRGRPAKLFAITDAGRSAFVHAYDDLATSALRFLAETAGEPAVAEFARRQIADLERRYRPEVQAAPAGQRVRALAEALSADGYVASASAAPPRPRPPSPGRDEHVGERQPAGGERPGGEQLCQHHCPVAHVAAEFPQLCEAETEAFGRLLGTPVQRLATIAHGDGVCTTHVSPQALRGPTRGKARKQDHQYGRDHDRQRDPQHGYNRIDDEESGGTPI
jgi:predicted ArsR family transcriptional regulator